MMKNSVSLKKKCKFCDKDFHNNFSYKCHLYQHNAVEPRFRCNICEKAYFRSDTYKRHMSRHCGKHAIKKNEFICDYCERSFVDKRNLITHLQVHEDYKISKKYKCLACGVQYCEERCLKYHIRRYHFNLQPKESIAVKKKPNETWIEPVLESKICVQMTKVNDNIIRIEKSVVKNETKPQLEYENGFKTYIYAEDNSQYSKAVCGYCNKEMLKKSLRPHIRERHLNLRRFTCDVCKCSFNRHYQLVNHACGKYKEKKRKLK